MRRRLLGSLLIAAAVLCTVAHPAGAAYLCLLVVAITAAGATVPNPSLRVVRPIVRAHAVSFFEWFGELAAFCGRAIWAAITPPYEIKELLRQCDAIGSRSLILTALGGAATGVVVTLQTRESLARFGARSMLPAVIVFSIIRETGPIITGLLLSGRVGAGIGAELGSMRVTEQIDAMEASAIDPYKHLVATRVAACVLMLPLLTVAADFSGILMGWVAAALSEPVSLRLFIETGFRNVTFTDFIPPTIKTTVFGFIIGSVASFQGMRTTGGTEGVGKAATAAVVLSSLFVILADVLLVRLILVFFRG